MLQQSKEQSRKPQRGIKGKDVIAEYSTGTTKEKDVDYNVSQIGNELIQVVSSSSGGLGIGVVVYVELGQNGTNIAFIK